MDLCTADALRMLFLENTLSYLVFPVNLNIGAANEAYFTGENAGLGRARYCPRFHTTAQWNLPRLSMYGYPLHSTASPCKPAQGSMGHAHRKSPIALQHGEGVTLVNTTAASPGVPLQSESRVPVLSPLGLG